MSQPCSSQTSAYSPARLLSRIALLFSADRPDETAGSMKSHMQVFDERVSVAQRHKHSSVRVNGNFTNSGRRHLTSTKACTF
mmetsp:Transcript_19988/g.60418  ORF Transcript_19988/g.60418 Transcript_19988/m.60418 type:complete len:82 (-) Transcript_19988:7-252(-)